MEKMEAKVLTAKERKRLYRESKEKIETDKKLKAIEEARKKAGLPPIKAGAEPNNIYVFKERHKEKCKKCKGTGMIIMPGSDNALPRETMCPICKGARKVIKERESVI
jgi:DnaJ-class molecular chaperone